MTYSDLQTTYQEAVTRLLLSLRSENTHRAYGLVLRQFAAFWEASGLTCDNAAEEWLHGQAMGEEVAPKTINLRATVLRALGKFAPEFAALATLEGVRQAGAQRLGVWLNRAQLSALLEAPDASTLAGQRDRALLACLSLAGMRREETVSLEWRQWAQIDAGAAKRAVWADVLGKGRKLRHVPLSAKAAMLVEGWRKASEAAGRPEAGMPVFCRVRAGDRPVWPEAITPRAAAKIVAGHAEAIGVRIAPHDLRRTFGGLALKGGATLRTVQQAYGHSSLLTTERYLNAALDVEDPATDHV